MSYGTVQAEKMTTESGYSLGAGNASSFKNRIINGGMVIDQRNAGAAVTLTEGGNNFITDRFQTYKANSSVTITGQRSSVAPSGFINSLLFTTTTGASIGAANEGQVRQSLEGLNIADLAWGTASAQSITISFWVRSSLTGTFAIAVQTSNVDAVYVTTYTISSANTFEYKTVTIPGPTSGTFPTNNGTGFSVIWDLGGGSNFNASSANTWTSGNRYTVAGTQKVMATTGATWYITGVQLEVGTVATSFDFRSIGTELALCQRYYEKSFSLNVAPGNSGSSTSIGATEGSVTGMAQNRLNAGPTVQFKVVKRAIPTMQKYGNSSGDWIYALQTANSWAGSSNTGLTRVSESSFSADQQAVDATAIFVSGHWAASAEL